MGEYPSALGSRERGGVTRLRHPSSFYRRWRDVCMRVEYAQCERCRVTQETLSVHGPIARSHPDPQERTSARAGMSQLGWLGVREGRGTGPREDARPGSR